jgi:hypothetical protein
MAKSWFHGNVVCPSCGEAVTYNSNSPSFFEHLSGRTDHPAESNNPGKPSIDTGNSAGGFAVPYMTNRKRPDNA